MKILIGFEESGKVRRAFAAKGHEVYSCDLLPSRDNSPFHIIGDVRPLLKKPWDLVICFPPCTHLCSSGARWFEQKRADGRQAAAIRLFYDAMNANAPRVGGENPIGIMSNIYRKPDQIIHPWQFGHGETKATCLWLKGLPKLIPENVVSGREQRIWKLPPSKDRSRIRSETFQGIANAMANQWG